MVDEVFPAVTGGHPSLTHEIEVESLIGRGVKLIITHRNKDVETERVLVFITPKAARELGDSIFRAAQVAEQ